MKSKVEVMKLKEGKVNERKGEERQGRGEMRG